MPRRTTRGGQQNGSGSARGQAGDGGGASSGDTDWLARFIARQPGPAGFLRTHARGRRQQATRRFPYATAGRPRQAARASRRDRLITTGAGGPSGSPPAARARAVRPRHQGPPPPVLLPPAIQCRHRYFLTHLFYFGAPATRDHLVGPSRRANLARANSERPILPARTQRDHRSPGGESFMKSGAVVRLVCACVVAAAGRGGAMSAPTDVTSLRSPSGGMIVACRILQTHALRTALSCVE